MNASSIETEGVENRNHQADVALNRVQAKLYGQEFVVANTLSTSPKVYASPTNAHVDPISLPFTESPKDSVAPSSFTAFFDHAAVSADSLDVPSQVDRLIQEATSLDNLAMAYITGWAPFW